MTMEQPTNLRFMTGHLITEVLVPRYSSAEFWLCYRDKEDDVEHVRNIARIVGFYAEPYFSGSVACALNNPTLWHGTSHHYSTWEELCALPRLWSSKTPISNWLKQVEEEPMLAESQKVRLRRAIAREQ